MSVVCLFFTGVVCCFGSCLTESESFNDSSMELSLCHGTKSMAVAPSPDAQVAFDKKMLKRSRYGRKETILGAADV